MYVESSKTIYWDGRTEDGEQASSVTYFYQIQDGDTEVMSQSYCTNKGPNLK